jgi:predicted acyl esterase
VELQLSFLDAFLKGDDRIGWTVPGKVPKVEYIVRKGDVGFNDPAAEGLYQRATASAWPLPNTVYKRFFLTNDRQLVNSTSSLRGASKLTYNALGTLETPSLITFTTPPFKEETEITGHITAHLNVSISGTEKWSNPTDMDLFLTLRHISPTGSEILYTGTIGDPVPLTKGWLRVSLRKVDNDHPRHRPWLPYRNYFSSDVQLLEHDHVYAVDVELWPTNVVVEKEGRIAFEISSGDTQGCGLFQHNSPSDRSVLHFDFSAQLNKYTVLTYNRDERVFGGLNHLHFNPDIHNFLTLPVIDKLSS